MKKEAVEAVEVIEVPYGKRTSMDNMICLVNYEELTDLETYEVEDALALGC